MLCHMCLVHEDFPSKGGMIIIHVSCFKVEWDRRWMSPCGQKWQVTTEDATKPKNAFNKMDSLKKGRVSPKSTRLQYCNYRCFVFGKLTKAYCHIGPICIWNFQIDVERNLQYLRATCYVKRNMSGSYGLNMCSATMITWFLSWGYHPLVLQS